MALLKKIGQLPISFGGASISGEGGGYGFGACSDEQARTLLNYSFEKGVRVYDTAPIYGFGMSEQRIGLAFHHCREKVFIVSKCGVSWHENKRVNMTNDPKVAARMFDESRQRLQSDYIDLYMIHWPDEKVDIRKPLEILAKLQLQGKIKHIGLCNTHFEDLEKAKELCQIEVVQSEFNYFNRSQEKLFSYLRENQISFMSYGTFDKGILTGRVTQQRKFDTSDLRSWAPWWKARNNSERIEKVKELSKELVLKGQTLISFALQHNLSYPEIESAIVGYRTPAQLDEIIKALNEKTE